jgi:hypothetical protein
MARVAGVELRWAGLEPGRLKGLRPLGSLPSRSRREHAQAQRGVRHAALARDGRCEDHPSMLSPIV